MRLPIADCRWPMVRREFWLAWLGAWLLVSSAAGQGVTAGLDRNSITLGESARLQLTIQGSAKEVPQSPQVPGLAITLEGQANQFYLSGGRAISVLTLSYRLTPQTAGDFNIPSFTIIVDGKPQPTPPLQLKVLPRAAAPATPAGQAAELGQLAFLKLIPSRTNTYVGEIFPVEIQLYFQGGRNVQMPNLRCEGFTIGKMTHTQTHAQFGNLIYNLISFKTLITPVKSGPLKLGPVECALNVQVRNPNPEPFQPPFVFREVSPRSEVLEINVLPLPTNSVPASFAGAVGNFELTFTAGPTNVLVGDPVTVKIQITGRGAFDNVLAPSLAEWREFKSYAPTVKTDTFDPLSVMGVKNFEQIVVPQNAEIRELPPFEFSFFDPQQQAYRTIKRGPVALVVRPNNAAAQQPTVVTDSTPGQPAPPATTDIVHIKPSLGVAGALRPALVTQPWFLALQAVPLAAWLTLLVRRRREEKLANNPRLRRQREVALVIAAGVDELRRQALTQPGAEFFANLARLLQEQLGERLDLPASAITESVIAERLLPGGVPEAELAGLRELFQVCDHVRYAKEPTAQELAALLPKIESVLTRLRALEVKV